MLLLQNHLAIKCHAYLLCFPVGSAIAQHQDPAQEGWYFRLNIIIKKSQSGGELICEKGIINLPRVKRFRPDLYLHEVSSQSTRCAKCWMVTEVKVEKIIFKFLVLIK